MSITSDTQFDEYLELFRRRIRERRIGEVEDASEVSPVGPREIATTEVFLEILEDIGQLPGLDLAHFEKRLGRANGKVNAYGVSEADARVDLVVTVCGDDEEQFRTVPASEIESAARRALHVFRAAKEPLFEEMEPSSAAFDMMERLHQVRPHARSIRLVILVAGLAKRPAEFERVGDLPDTQIDLWDLERLYRADTSGLTYESFEIDLVEHLGQPLPCLTTPGEEPDHQCFLAAFPGDLLHDLYQKYGARLLELNVRSFLQARGKVNRGLRDTLKNDPGHFMAFNNGISITAEDLDLVCTSDGLSIRSVRGLQIVNGGQTVASIHRSKNRDKADLSRVFVQAKITQVAPDHMDFLVPFISRYSNTQNKVNETDFSANHPFHVRIQKLSEQIWVPGETSRWFYERARGQWEVARAREGTTPARIKTFDQKSPRKQKVDKTLLAKAFNAWDELPHVVSLGGQKNFVRFMELIGKHGDSWEPDESFYRDLMSKVIVFKAAERTARQHGFSAYRANAICYTVALLAYRTAGRVDLSAIWQQQAISEALEGTLQSWMPVVHEEIVGSADHRNVTEWCKNAECWTHLQSLRLDFSPGFEQELAKGLPLPNVGQFKERKDKPARGLTPEERDRQAKAMRHGADDWLNVMNWARESGELNDFQMKLAGTVLGYAAGGWRQVPSPKQTRHTSEILALWEQRGSADNDELS